MRSKIEKKWNRDVSKQIKKLEPVRKWLNQWIREKDTDWETQKSAHQAAKLLEMAQFAMLNMQWWEKGKERVLYNKAEDTVNPK